MLGAALVVLSYAGAAHGWETQFEPVPTFNGSPAAREVAVAPDGNLVAVGGQPFVAVLLSAGTGAILWRHRIAPSSESAAVAIDQAGDFVVAGRAGEALVVVKLAATTGLEMWRHEGAPGIGRDVALDAAGDVFVAGQSVQPTFDRLALVLKLAGATGVPVWEQTIDPSMYGVGSAVRVTSGGDAVVLASLGANSSAPRTPIVLRLAGTDGNEQWRRTLGTASLEDPVDLVIAPSGDAIFGGWGAVFALSAATGDPSWTHVTSSAPQIARIALHPSGDVVAGDGAGRIVRLSHTDGAVRWQHDLGCAAGDMVAGLSVDAGGDVLAAVEAPGCVEPVSILGTREGNLVAAKLTGVDGSERWRRVYGGVRPGLFAVSMLVASHAGDAIVAGAQYAVHRGYSDGSFTVFSLAGDDGALGVCDDGFLDPGEECDAGNDLGTTCCSGTCRVVTGSEGAACNDGDACTAGDVCKAGACTPGGPLRCAPCGTCSPREGCMTWLPYDCREPTASHKAVVAVADGHGATDDAVAWAWRSGAATTKSDFGDPLVATSYALCMFGEDRSVLFAAEIPSNAACAKGRKCWRAKANGYVYRASSAKPDGIVDVSLHAGPPGRARIVARGKGGKLMLPAMPLDGPMTMQLRRLDGSGPCWEATHDLIRKNRSRRLVATNR